MRIAIIGQQDFGKAVLEAMAGQIFLATLVARLVSAYGTTRRRPPPSE